MNVQLGSAFGPLILDEPDLLMPAPPDEVSLRLDLVLAALQNLSLTLTNLPTPEVVIDAPDLSAIVTAVNGLKPGADADQIAEAVVRTLGVSAQPQGENVVTQKLIDALEKLDFRLRGAANHTAAVTLPNDSTRQLGIVTVSNPTANTETGLAKEVTLGRKFAPNTARITRAVQVSTIGSNTVYTPAAGKAIRLHWVGMSSSQNNAGETLVSVLLGGVQLYRWNMGNPGAFSHYEIADGAVNGTLTVSLSAAYPVEMNYTVEEV